MNTSYTTIAAPSEAEVEARRSRFLARLEPVTAEEDARAVVEAARRRHWDARHHCSAFVLGPDGATRRSSDDGEPAGTAGAPMLEALTGRGLTDVVAVVTRWFGGTLLGTGGLIRAYSQAVAAAAGQARLVTCELRDTCTVTVSPAHAGRLEHALRASGYDVLGTSYGARDAQVRVSVPPGQAAQLTAAAAAATAGAAQVAVTGTAWSASPPRTPPGSARRA